MSKLAASSADRSSIDASNRANVEPALGGHLAIEGQHLGADVDDRHHGPGRGIQRALPSAAGRQAQHPPGRRYCLPSQPGASTVASGLRKSSSRAGR